MFYRKVKGDTTGAAERESIILKEIEKIYGDKINSLAFLVPMENKETTGSGILVERLGHEIVNARYMSRDCPHVLCQRIMDIIIHD